MDVKKSKITLLINVLSIVISLYMILNLTLSASYTVLSADDFSHANGINTFLAEGLNYFEASIKYDLTMYRNWQGTYFSMFCQAFFSPLNGYGLPQLRIIMICNALLFLAHYSCLLYHFLVSFLIKMYGILCCRCIQLLYFQL